MQKELRLTSSGRFSQIHEESRAWVNNLLVLKALKNDGGETRFGLITTRRIGNAVARNMVRRRLREVLRNTPVKPGWDVVLIARNRDGVHIFSELQGAAWSLLQRANLLEAGPNEKGALS